MDDLAGTIKRMKEWDVIQPSDFPQTLGHSADKTEASAYASNAGNSIRLSKGAYLEFEGSTI